MDIGLPIFDFPYILIRYNVRFKLRFLMINATFNNISVISWRSIFLVEETGVPGENRGPTYNPIVRQSDSPIVRRSDSPTVRQSDKCFISLKVNTITCVIWCQKPNRLLAKERSRTSETRYRRRTNNWQGHTRTQKNTYMNNTDSIKTWIQS